MATTVRYHETSPTKYSGANIKKILLAVIEQNNPEMLKESGAVCDSGGCHD